MINISPAERYSILYSQVQVSRSVIPGICLLLKYWLQSATHKKEYSETPVCLVTPLHFSTIEFHIMKQKQKH